MDCIIETKDLTKEFGSSIAVNSINMHVERGKIYGLLGKNGAGKTTTMCMLLNLATPSSGDIFINGENIKDSKKYYSKIGSIIEVPGFYENLSAFDNLKFISKLRGNYDKSNIERVLSVVSLTGAKNKKFKNFSLGMKQRLGIAAAIMHNPEILILDEPINGLDPIGIIEIRTLLKRLVSEYGTTIIISSHILSEIEIIADVIGVMKDGVLVEEISKDELKNKLDKYLEIEVSDLELATNLLEKIGFKKGFDFKIELLYDLVDSSDNIKKPGLIKLFSNINLKSKINKLFVKEGIDIEKLVLCEESLEEYFTVLIN